MQQISVVCCTYVVVVVHWTGMTSGGPVTVSKLTHLIMLFSVR